MPDIGFVNGRFMPLAEATVSVEDRGFQFGDGVYEVIRTYGGRPYRLEAHLARLERSAKALGISMPFSMSQWSSFVTEGLRLTGYGDTKVYLQLTRGVAPRDHLIPTEVQPTAVMTFREMRPMDPAMQAAGVAAITVEDFRWGRCDIKSVNLLANVLARQMARDAGVFETIFVRGGQVTEGAVSNVMLIRRGVLVTPPESERILSGVTRTVVLEVARHGGVPVEERAVRIEELRIADEAFLTGTTVEILPLICLDGSPIGAGRPGELSTRLKAWFRATHE